MIASLYDSIEHSIKVEIASHGFPNNYINFARDFELLVQDNLDNMVETILLDELPHHEGIFVLVFIVAIEHTVDFLGSCLRGEQTVKAIALAAQVQHSFVGKLVGIVTNCPRENVQSWPIR